MNTASTLFPGISSQQDGLVLCRILETTMHLNETNISFDFVVITRNSRILSIRFYHSLCYDILYHIH